MIETVLHALIQVVLAAGAVVVVACWVVCSVLVMVWPVTLLFARTNLIPMPFTMRVVVAALSLGVATTVIFMPANGMERWPDAVLVVVFYVFIAGVLLAVRPIAHEQKSEKG